jgi:hypothetical protein
LSFVIVLPLAIALSVIRPQSILKAHYIELVLYVYCASNL